jgi:hypothetical protein
MRIRVKDILDLLAAGVGQEIILKDYPYLEPDDIQAALEFQGEARRAAKMQNSEFRIFEAQGKKVHSVTPCGASLRRRGGSETRRTGSYAEAPNSDCSYAERSHR